MYNLSISETIPILEAIAKYVPEEYIIDFINESKLDFSNITIDKFVKELDSDDIELLIKFESLDPTINVFSQFIKDLTAEEFLDIYSYYDDFLEKTQDKLNSILEDKLKVDNNEELLENILFNSNLVVWNCNIDIENDYMLDLSDISTYYSILSLDTIKTYFNLWINSRHNWFKLPNIDTYINGLSGLIEYIKNVCYQYYSSMTLDDLIKQEHISVSKNELLSYLNDVTVYNVFKEDEDDSILTYEAIAFILYKYVYRQ